MSKRTLDYQQFVFVVEVLCIPNSVDVMKIRKRNALLIVHHSVAYSFNQTSRRLGKEGDCSQSKLTSLGLYYHTLFRTGSDPIKLSCIPCSGQRGFKTIPYPHIAQIREYPIPPGVRVSKYHPYYPLLQFTTKFSPTLIGLD